MSETTRTTRSAAPKIALIIGTLLLITMFVAAFVMSNNGVVSATPTTPPSNTATTEPAPAATSTVACEPQFTQSPAQREGNKVDSDFEVKYATATAEANNLTTAQREVLLEQAGKDALALAAWAHAFGLYEEPNEWNELVNGNCLSSEGERLFYQFEGVLSASGTTFDEADAPANGYNSGIDNGTYGVASYAGISGDRKAIKVTLKDGSIVYIMVRCGNPVYKIPPPDIPDVPTDEPEPKCPPEKPIGTPPNCKDKPEKPKEPKPKCPADKPHGTWPVCKDSPSKDPAPRDKAPDGGGKNDDEGPGDYKEPDEVTQPPTTPRKDPKPPAAEPPTRSTPKPSDPSPKPAPTKDPAPAPTREPEAPAPTAPETECIPIPGVEDCS